jgi:hypothetical protein
MGCSGGYRAGTGLIVTDVPGAYFPPLSLLLVREENTPRFTAVAARDWRAR